MEGGNSKTGQRGERLVAENEDLGTSGSLDVGGGALGKEQERGDLPLA